MEKSGVPPAAKTAYAPAPRPASTPIRAKPSPRRILLFVRVVVIASSSGSRFVSSEGGTEGRPSDRPPVLLPYLPLLRYELLLTALVWLILAPLHASCFV